MRFESTHVLLAGICSIWFLGCSHGVEDGLGGKSFVQSGVLGDTAELRKRLPTLLRDAEVPGVSIAVVSRGARVWTTSAGIAEDSSGQSVTDTTIFEAASLSKPVFAYAVLQLVEKGELSLDTPLVRYFDTAYVEDSRGKLITARHVLTHSTGFPNWRPDGQPLRMYFTPGSRYSYSGEGLVYLQRVVEHLKG